MTRILAPSGGGKVTKPTRAPEPKRVYVKITPPKPKPIVETGNNPRGVAIVTKAPPSKTLTTGNNPRGVAIKNVRTVTAPVKKKVITLPKALVDSRIEPHSSGGGILGAIESTPIGAIAEHAISGVPALHIAENLGKDIVNYLPSTAEGISTIAKAGGEELVGDVGSGLLNGRSSNEGHPLLTAAKEAYKASVFHPLLEGRIADAVKMWEAHPLNVTLSLLGGAGVAGRLAGAGMRAGIIGEDAKALASTARADRPLQEGTLGTMRHYSPNVLKKAGQVAIENTPRTKAMEARLIRRGSKKFVDDIVGTNQAMARAPQEELVASAAKTLRGDNRIRVPKDRKVAGDIASHVIQGIASGREILDEVKIARDRIANRVAAHEASIKDGGQPLYDRASYREAQKHVKAFDEFLNHADPHKFDALEQIAKRYADYQHGYIDPEKERLGLVDSAAERRAELIPAVAAGHAGKDVRVLGKGEEAVSARAYYAREAKQEVKRAERAVADERVRGAKETAANRGPAYKALGKARRALESQRIQEARANGVLTGRHGRIETYESPTNTGETVTRVRLAEGDGQFATHEDVEKFQKIVKKQAKRSKQADERVAKIADVIRRAHGEDAPVPENVADQLRRWMQTAEQERGKLKDARKDLRVSERSPLPRDQADRMTSYISKTRKAEQHLKDAQDALLGQRRGNRLTADEHIKLAKQALKDAKSDHSALKQYENERIKGVVTNATDANGNELRLGRRNKDGSARYAVRSVSTDEIHQRLLDRNKNPDGFAYINLHAPKEQDQQGAIAVRGLSRGDSTDRTRTGKGALYGAYKANHTALIDSQQNDLVRISRAKGLDRLVKLRKKDLPPMSLTDAQQERNLLEHQDPRTKWTIVATHAAGKKGKMLDSIRASQSLRDDNTLPLTDDELAANEQTGHYINGKYKLPSEQRYALLPTTDVNRYLKHLEVDDRTNRGPLGKINRAFRNTVLPFSSKWFVGNIVESAVRSALAGNGPGDYHFATQLLAHMEEMAKTDPEMRDTINEIKSYTSGLHFGMAHDANQDATGAGALYKADSESMEKFKNTPGVVQLRAAGRAYTHLVQGIYAGNRALERQWEHAAFGGAAKAQLHEFQRSIEGAAKTQEEWMDHLATAYKTDPRLARDAGTQIHKVLGQYDRFGPKQKRMINTFLPFAPWYWNALRFLVVTMPVDHPLVSATLLASAQASQADYANRDVPHSKFGPLAVGSLLTDIDLGGGSHLDVNRYLPSGATSNGLFDYATGQFAPQFAGPVLALAGQNPYMEELKDSQGSAITNELGRTGIALNELVTSLLGPLGQASRVIQDHGETPADDSTIIRPDLKPGTAHNGDGLIGGLIRVFNPLEPTHLGSSGSTGSSSSNGPASGSAADNSPSSGSVSSNSPSSGSTPDNSPSSGSIPDNSPQ